MISQTAEYALRAVMVLGSSLGQPLTSHQLAERTRVPPDYLSKVLQALGRAGFVESSRGLGGGYTLVHSLDQISILDVIRAVDPVKWRMPPSDGTEDLTSKLLHLLQQRLDEGRVMVENLLGGTTIGGLIAETNRRRGDAEQTCNLLIAPPAGAPPGRLVQLGGLPGPKGSNQSED